MIKLSYEVPKRVEAYTATRSLDMTIESLQPVCDIIEAFSDFLKASGYMFTGRIELISEEEAGTEEVEIEEEAETEDQIILKQLLDALSADIEALRADT